jgi:Mrp family chromosome partitioning ATPase
MSRNYELLNQMGKTQVLLDSEPDPASALPKEFLPGVSLSAPLLQIERIAKEEITRLVQRLFILGGAEGPRRVGFIGAESGNGNTWMCAHVGDILASLVDRSVCLVDCNFRSPALHQQFVIENQRGLADALRGHTAIAKYAQQLRRNLFVLSCGTMDEDTELLTSDRMRLRLAELGRAFDYVLMDVPSLNSSNHGIVLGSSCDGVVLVLKANSSRRESARQAVQQFQAANIPVLGAVLNQRTFPIPEKIYKML